MLKFTPIYENFSSYDVAYFNKQTDWLLKSVMMIDLATDPHFIARNMHSLKIHCAVYSFLPIYVVSLKDIEFHILVLLQLLSDHLSGQQYLRPKSLTAVFFYGTGCGTF